MTNLLTLAGRFCLNHFSDDISEVGLNQSQFLRCHRQFIEHININKNVVFAAIHSWGTAFLAGIGPAQAIPVLSLTF